MHRRPRIHLDDVPLHIVQRGHHRELRFFGEEDYQTYLHWLGEALKREGGMLHAYAVMTNHVHLLLTPAKAEDVPRIIIALGLSVQGVSKTQLETLKTRLEETKAKLEAAQAAPENQRAQILQGLTAEHLTGDLLTANIWSYFAALQGQGFLASTQAAMFDRPGLSYGLFHAMATPSKLYGQFTTGVKFQGVMMDIGHLRHLRWVKNDDPQAAINAKPELTANGKTAAHNRWVAYNRMRGQYASALEGGIPERMFIDRSQCRYVDPSTTPPTVVNPNLPDCPKAVSAVSAMAIAQAQGQKIFTITAKNADKAIPLLQHRGSVIEEIRSAIAAGKEVTIHEKAITETGWSGAGYAVIDPETGAGAYLIEGGARGAFWTGVVFGALVISTLMIFLGCIGALSIPTGGAAGAAAAIILLPAFLFLMGHVLAALYDMTRLMDEDARECFWGGVGVVLAGVGALGSFSVADSLKITPLLQQILGLLGVGLTIPTITGTAQMQACIL